MQGLQKSKKKPLKSSRTAQANCPCITEREAFSSGFILATRIMVEVMQGLEEVEDI